MANKNSAIRCVAVLLGIAVICVFLLAVLNDLLYVPPDMSVFNKAKEGEYAQVETAGVSMTSGKAVLIAEGKSADGKDVVGMYIQGNKYGKADVFQIAVVVDKATNIIEGVYLITDGSTGGYSYDASLLQKVVGKDITSAVFQNDKDLLKTGATHSSITVMNTLTAASEYYRGAYVK